MRRQIAKLDFFWLHRKVLVCAEQNKRNKKGTSAMPTFPQKKRNQERGQNVRSLEEKSFSFDSDIILSLFANFVKNFPPVRSARHILCHSKQHKAIYLTKRLKNYIITITEPATPLTQA